MLLVIDVGNTNMEFGVYRGEELVGSFRLMTDANRTSDELGLWLCQYFQRFGLELGQVEDVVIGSVAPQVMHTLSRAVQKYVGKTPLVLDEVLDPRKTIVFVLTLGTAVFGSILFRKFFSVIPILIAVIVGYASALAAGIVDFAEVAAAPVFALPNFSTPKFNLEAIMIILPVLLVITSEHIGHQVVTSKIVGRDLLKGSGPSPFPRSEINFSTMISGLIGSVPTTTYGENIGVMAITRVYSVRVIAGAAVLSIVCSFIGKFSTLISTIPGPVIGGISFLLYGMIGTSGLRILVDSRVDYGNSRNLALTSVIFVTGLSGIAVKFGNVQLTGMVLACVVGMYFKSGYFMFWITLSLPMISRFRLKNV